MDIGTVFVVLLLIALSLGAIAWMEIHSRKNSSEKRDHNVTRSEVKKKRIAKQSSPFLSLRLNGPAPGKTRAQEKKL